MSDIFENIPNPNDRYILNSILGCGVYGKVYNANDTKVGNKKVAIKTQKLDGETRPFIEKEYRILKDFSEHINLIDFYGIYRKDNEIWFVLELCEGGPVTDLVNVLIEKTRRLSEEHIAYILKDTVKALVYLHENRVIHRDVKGANILLTNNGEVKLTDFGYSPKLENTLDKTGTYLGSPGWIAPEMIKNEPYDNRIDVWSLGITAIEIGDGKTPYQTMHPTRALFQIVKNPPPTLYRTSNWSNSYNDFINECLVKNPEHRPYAVELLDHPFLVEIPENNYHLTLEIKSLLNENSQKIERYPEDCVYNNFIKTDRDGGLEKMPVEDLASLKTISEKNLLNEILTRLENNEHQTFVGDILLIINPNKKLSIYGDDFHKKYRSMSRSDNAPHVYAIADSAYQSALHHKMPQKIVLSGESCSGKTTNFLHLIDHLFHLGDNFNVNLNRLKSTIKVIHALTHSTTPTNPYSTRCLLKTELTFGATGKITGLIFSVFQLEKWRISSVDMLQGNFHMLYYVYDGLIAKGEHEKYCLNPGRNYRYLRIAGDKTVTPRNDLGKNVAKFEKIVATLEELQFKPEQIQTIYTTISAILLIGEIRFVNDGVIENLEILDQIADLLQIDGKKLKWALTHFCVLEKGVVTSYKSTVDEARDARDVLANNLYHRLVDYIVAVINNKLQIGRSIFGEEYLIKIYDYFGFECFKTNHLPQLFVNTLNEQLQYHFLQRTIAWEHLDVMHEDIYYKSFDYYDNKKTLDLLLAREASVFTSIDESAKTGQMWNYIIKNIEQLNSKHVRLESVSEFSVAHYTGKVKYLTKEMPDRNRDFLPPEIIETMRLSDNPIIKLFFTNNLDKFGNLIVEFPETGGKRKNSLAKINPQFSQIRKIRTAIATFKSTCYELLKDLSIGNGTGGTHFIRCIRSNLSGNPRDFNPEMIRHQLRALSVLETAKARQYGYPHRISFADFLARYKFLAFDYDETVDISRENCRLLLVRLKMEGWAIGKTKVFLKYYNEEYLAKLYENQVKKIVKIQSILRAFLAKSLVNKKMQSTKEVKQKVDDKCSNEKKYTFSKDEAAKVIQRAFRQTTIRKTYAEFSKDFTILDEDACGFIQTFADKWKTKSIFQILLLYRSAKFQESFSLAQQVHFYNLKMFHYLDQIKDGISLENIDNSAKPENWLGQKKFAVNKLKFSFDEIFSPITPTICKTLTNTGECDEDWDSPYNTRKTTENKILTQQKTEDLIHLSYTRDPKEEIQELPKLEEPKPIEPEKPKKSENSEKTEKPKEIKKPEETEKPEKIDVEPEKSEATEKLEKPEKTDVKPEKPADNPEKPAIKPEKPPPEPKEPPMKKDKLEKDLENKSIQSGKLEKENANSTPANKDFEYIKAPILDKRKHDPIVELKNIVRRNSMQTDDDNEAPFNFQGMLRKTNFRKDISKKEDDTEQTTLTFTRQHLKSVNGKSEMRNLCKTVEPGPDNKSDVDMNDKSDDIIEDSNRQTTDLTCGKKIAEELLPGLYIEGIEIQL